MGCLPHPPSLLYAQYKINFCALLSLEKMKTLLDTVSVRFTFMYFVRLHCRFNSSQNIKDDKSYHRGFCFSPEK